MDNETKESAENNTEKNKPSPLGDRRSKASSFSSVSKTSNKPSPKDDGKAKEVFDNLVQIRDNNSLSNDDKKGLNDKGDLNYKREIENKKNAEHIQNNQIKWIVFLMIAIILIIFVVSYINKNFINSFDYNGFRYQKTKLGDIFFYSTRFPVVSGTGKVIGNYAFNFRNDPRKLEYVKTDITNDRIEFSITKGKYDPVYISLDPFMEICEYSVVSLATLSGFLQDSGLEVRSAYTDKAYARDNNQTQRWCDNSVFDTVIIVKESNATEINEISPFCYEISFTNCEIMAGIEKFILINLEQYADRFE